jgi:penicillin-binding protein 1A
MYSINVVTIKLLEKLGIQPVVSVARRLGITTPIKPNLSLGLGTSEVTLAEMVQAFSTFANQGVRPELYGILTVKDSDGRVLENNAPVVQEALDPQTAYIMVNALRDVIDHGTGRIIRRLGFTYPAAGKTGTTNDNVDAWFIGFTPDLACGVWVGYDERQSLGRRQTGGETAAPVWADFMKAATAGKPPKEFTPPTGSENEFVRKKICTDSGELACANCPRPQDEMFKKETAPTKLCPLHCGANPLQPAGGGGNAPGGDILEMEAQSPAAPETITAPQAPSTAASGAVSAPEKPGPPEKKPITDQQAYPDEGF